MTMQEGVRFPPPGWTELVRGLPDAPGLERESKIIELVRQGYLLPVDWCNVQISDTGHTIQLQFPKDALKLGSLVDNCRFNMTATGSQTLCDMYGWILPTTKITDVVYKCTGNKITPCTQTPDSMMAYTSRMTQHSRAVDTKLAGDTADLVDTVGKYWVLTNKLAGLPNKAANYGWHTPSHSQFKSDCGLFILQCLATAHDRWHVDYSQIFRPAKNWALVDGVEMLLSDVYTDPELAPLVSYEGVLKATRMVGVPEVQRVA